MNNYAPANCTCHEDAAPVGAHPMHLQPCSLPHHNLTSSDPARGTRWCKLWQEHTTWLTWSRQQITWRRWSDRSFSQGKEHCKQRERGSEKERKRERESERRGREKQQHSSRETDSTGWAGNCYKKKSMLCNLFELLHGSVSDSDDKLFVFYSSLA